MQFTPLGSLVEGSVAVLSPERLEATRERLEAGLARLSDLHDEMSARAALLTSAISRAEGLRQTMLNQLDAITPDCDLEESGDDELLLGWSAHDHQERLGTTTDDREAVSEDEGAQCEDEGVLDNEDGCWCMDVVGGGEYSLGWSEGESLQQDKPARGSPDHEPSLGSSAALDQRSWVHAQERHARDFDDEYQCEDEGAAGNYGADDKDDAPTPSAPNWPPAPSPWPLLAPPARTDRAGFNPYGNVGEMVPLTAERTRARQAEIDAMVDEYDMLAIGKPSPFAISLRLASAGLL